MVEVILSSLVHEGRFKSYSLNKANKDLDFLILPNARHGYGRDGTYVMRRRWDYFVRHLMQAMPPPEYVIKIEPDPREAAEKK